MAFGIQTLDKDIIGASHHFLERGIFSTHRDLDVAMSEDREVYLYTGRGPSSQSMHIGHLIPFTFTKFLQDTLRCKLVIMLSDDEKYLHRGLTLAEVRRVTAENRKDIEALGFSGPDTFIFNNLDHMGLLYPTVCEVQSCLTVNQVKGAFGFDDSKNVGAMAYPAIQAAPCFAQCFPDIVSETARAIVPCAIDQDPYFRIARKIADRLHKPKPAIVHSTFLPGLDGQKMSSSSPAGAIFLDDSPETIRKKVFSSFSGGRALKADQLLYGANLDVDVPFQLLRHFCEDESLFQKIAADYGAENHCMLGKDVKEQAVKVIVNVVDKFKLARQ